MANLAFNRENFFSGYRKKYGALNQTQVNGLDSLLTGIEQDSAVTDVRWAAYMLATVKHECADRYQPLEEFGKGKGRKYGSPVKLVIDGKTYNNVYFGRGYVQLTWDFNYKNLGAALGLGHTAADESRAGVKSRHCLQDNVLRHAQRNFYRQEIGRHHLRHQVRLYEFAQDH